MRLHERLLRGIPRILLVTDDEVRHPERRLLVQPHNVGEGGRVALLGPKDDVLVQSQLLARSTRARPYYTGRAGRVPVASGVA